MKRFTPHSPVFFLAAITFFLCIAAGKRFVPAGDSGHEVSVEYESRNGMFDGVYRSYYRDGTKKSEGRFSMNMRVGTWTVWDSTGKMRMQREYKTSYEYTRVFPPLPQDGPVKLFSVPMYTLSYNCDGYINYCPVTERAVTTAQRLWRYIPRDENCPLFANDDRLYKMLLDSVRSGKLQAYDRLSDDCRVKLSPAGKQSLTDTAGFEVAGYRIREDWFFDHDRMCAEARISAICPVLRKKDWRIKPDLREYDQCWLNFSAVRKTLASIKIDSAACPSYIRTLDDLFFFRYFHGDIYKEMNPDGLLLKDYVPPEHLPFEQERIELSLIEMEHDLWLEYAPR